MAAARFYACIAVCFTAAACDRTPRTVSNPILNMPASQQRVLLRSELGLQWPFTIGEGTLGCASGAVVFRSGEVTYGLNDAARATGFAAPMSIQVHFHAEPQNPLKRITQETRTKIFADAMACRSVNESCRHGIREARGLTDEELQQIETEGKERRWPPLAPEYVSLAPVVEKGLKLCPAQR